MLQYSQELVLGIPCGGDFSCHEADQTVCSGITQMTLNWQVYIILCSDDSFYTGITTDIERRFHQHADGSGAKYFRGRKPLQVVYLENNHSRSSAARREAQIKTMTRKDKSLLVSSAIKSGNLSQDFCLRQDGQS